MNSKVMMRLAMLALGTLLALTLLATAEGVLWLLDLGGGRQQDPFVGFSNMVPMFELTTADDGSQVYRTAAARGAPVPAEFAAAKPADGFRVFVVGGSSSAGTPYDYQNAFGGWLSRRLAAMLPNVPTKVVNASINAYGSRRILSVVREIETYQPDLLIIYIGHNEIAESRYYAHLTDLHPLLFRVWTWVASTRLYVVLAESGPLGAVSERLRGKPVGFGDTENALEYFAAESERIDGVVSTPRDLEYRELHYRHNLEAMIESMRSVGARTLLLTQSQNFADWPPGASSHRDGLGEDQRATWQRWVTEGDRARESSGCKEAMPHYQKALEIDDSFAALHFRLANCQRSLGAGREAARHYRRASDLDRVPHGAPTRYNEIVRDVASQRGALLVDIEEIFANESPDGLVGDNWFSDLVHPNLRGHQRIAEAVAEKLAQANLPVNAEVWETNAYREPAVETLYREDPRLRLREHTIRAAACLLSRLRECARENAQAVLDLEPEDEMALELLEMAREIREPAGSP